MANTVSYSNKLQFDALFVDGDTRTFNITNPKDNITTSDIAELNNIISEGNILIGDKYGGRFGRINTAKRIRKITTTLDLDRS